MSIKSIRVNERRKHLSDNLETRVSRLTRNELIAAINYRGGRRGGKEPRYISTTLVSIALTRARVVIMQMQYAIYNRSKR